MQVTYQGPLAPPITVRPAGSEVSLDFTGDPLEVTPAIGATLVATGEWAQVGKKTPTIAEIQADVGDDPVKAAQALGLELARPNPRSSLVEHLSALVPQED